MTLLNSSAGDNHSHENIVEVNVGRVEQGQAIQGGIVEPMQTSQRGVEVVQMGSRISENTMGVEDGRVEPGQTIQGGIVEPVLANQRGVEARIVEPVQANQRDGEVETSITNPITNQCPLRKWHRHTHV